jgi:hypothetical protein
MTGLLPPIPHIIDAVIVLQLATDSGGGIAKISIFMVGTPVQTAGRRVGPVAKHHS